MSGRPGVYDARALLAALEEYAGPGASARALADLAGVTRGTICRWRSGEHVSVRDDVADRIESLTGVWLGNYERVS